MQATQVFQTVQKGRIEFQPSARIDEGNQDHQAQAAEAAWEREQAQAQVQVAADIGTLGWPGSAALAAAAVGVAAVGVDDYAMPCVR